ncbi:hypothetical protein ACFE04_001361 [Oxalis oulophora]
MSADDPDFVAWEEHIVCHQRGSRVVNYYLKDADGNSVLAVLGTEKSVRHMLYVISGNFIKAYESKNFISPSTKWRAKRHVVDWLTSMTSKNRSGTISHNWICLKTFIYYCLGVNHMQAISCSL